MKTLTIKQQAKHRLRAFRLLTAMGFKTEISGADTFYWLKLGDDNRLCIGFDVADQCLGGRIDWAWKETTLTENPNFGYSGTTSVGPEWATSEEIISVTLDKIKSIGVMQGLLIERAKTAKIKASLAVILAAI